MAKEAVRQRNVPSDESPIVVEPRWLLRATAIVLGMAFLCGYVTLCWLFYQGQWQLVLHPVRTAQRPATIGGAAYQFIRFGPDASGVPQRTAWSMTAEPNDRYRHLVVLYLPSGDGSLADETPMLDGLRRLGIAIFAVNYRGYGESAAVHPSEAGMREDVDAAWTYLVQEKKVQGVDVIPFGTGVGASLAMHLVAEHPEIAGVLLRAPIFDVLARVRADRRVRFLPVDTLLHDRFALEPDLSTSKVPKLIFSTAMAESDDIRKAGDPKITVEMERFDPSLFDRSLRRFLDVYAPPTPMERLLPEPVPAR